MQSYTGLNNKILTYNDYNVKAGDEIEVTSKIYIQSSSGAQEGLAGSPRFRLQDSSGNCSITLPRSLSDANDVGTVVLYLSCDVNISDNVSFELYADVQAGETLIIQNATITGSEMTEIDVSTGNLPPIVSIVVPENGSTVWYDDQPFNFSVSDPNENIDYCNVTLNGTILKSNITSNTLVNYTNLLPWHR